MLNRIHVVENCLLKKRKTRVGLIKVGTIETKVLAMMPGSVNTIKYDEIILMFIL